jgi:hypothetical protein
LKGKSKKQTGRKGESSADLYDGFTSPNPAFLRHLKTVSVARAHFFVDHAPAWSKAQQRAVKHLDLLPYEGHTATWIPPVHIFYGCESPERLLQYAQSAAVLLPSILSRITMARHDATLVPLNAKQWKQILGGEHWRNNWPVDKRPDFSMEADFWRYGSDQFFGRTMSRDIEHGRTQPLAGRLACKCKPTLALMRGDGELIAMIVASLNQWLLMHQLAALAQGALADAGIPAILHGEHGVQRVPDFIDKDRNCGARVLRYIKRIVLGTEDGLDTVWPPLWSGANEMEVKKARGWVEALRVFCIIVSDRTVDFGGLGDGWMGDMALRNAQLGSFPLQKLEQHADEYLARLFVLCFKSGRWPEEFLIGFDDDCTVKCKDCRAFRPALNYDQDLSDEGE